MYVSKFINRVRLRTKMAILVGTLISMTVTVAVVGALSLQGAGETTRELIDRAIPLRNGVLEIGRLVSDSHSTTVALLMTSPRSESAAELRDDRDGALSSARQRVESLNREFAAGEDAPSFAALRERIEAMDSEQREIIEILAEDTADARRDAVDQARGSGEAAFAATQAELDSLLTESARRVEAASARIEENSTACMRSLAGATLLAIVLGFGIGSLIVRSVRKPLVDTTNVLKDMLAGDADFTRRVPRVRTDEFGDLSSAFNAFLEKQRQIFRQVMCEAKGVQQASMALSEISEKIEAAARRTSERTSEVSNGTRSIREKLESTSVGVTKLAEDMNGVRAEVDAAAERSGRAVASAESAGETMTRLSKASQEIGTVVKVISSIAEQTNLLALNATIEAARAGELGKGFAVVATEVKELAKGSSGATVDIDRRITAIRNESNQAKDSIDAIRATIEDLNRSVGMFANVARSQSDECRGVAGSVEDVAKNASEISDNVRDLEAIASEGAACAADARGAASELSRIASGLGTLVGRFKVD